MKSFQEQGLPGFTETTITDVESLKEALAQIRERGYAYDLGEIISDLRCVAAPIRDFRGQVIAAISMSLPAYRFERSEQHFRNAIVRSGQQISRHMGYVSKKTS